MKMNMDGFAMKIDVDKVSKMFDHYAQVSHVKDLKDDIADFVKKDDFNIVAREIDYMKKDLLKTVSKEEIMTRLTVFNSEMNTKLLDRPTIQYFKKVL